MTKIGYCMKCKKRVEIKEAVEEKLKNRTMIKGVCSKCGTRMSKFV